MAGSFVTAGAMKSPRLTMRGLVIFAIVLGLLYFGRTVLVPIVVALMLGLVVAPLVNRFERTGFSRAPAVVASVLVLCVVLIASATVLGTQVLRMAASLPQYAQTLQQKLQDLNAVTVGRLDTLTAAANHVLEGSTEPVPTLAPTAQPNGDQPTSQVAHLQLLGRILASVWTPIETGGIILIVLVFVLLEQRALRDRVVSIVGGANIRLTTLALNDAGERLSRYFASQFAVNLGVGTAISLGLWLCGVPSAMLWGVLAAILRFVPYVGVWIAGILSSVLALAVVPGWSLALATLGLFAAVELVAGQVVEPFVYGHTSGLSPLSVVVAAIFWSAIWGPAGLILSTPLTLCLVVMGHHVPGLGFLEVLLGDAQALSLPERFYQRALAGDSAEIIAVARDFLKRNSMASYCDLVLMPAIHLSFLDFELGAISQEQQQRLREVVVTVVSALSDGKTGRPRRAARASVVAARSPGQLLRQHREQLMGKWQGPIAVPPGSVILCFGVGAPADAIGAELLVRSMREEKLDARHFSLEDLEAPPADADPASLAAIYLVSAFPNAERARAEPLNQNLRARFPNAKVITLLVPGVVGRLSSGTPTEGVDHIVTSFVEAVRLCREKPEEAPTIARSA